MGPPEIFIRCAPRDVALLARAWAQIMTISPGWGCRSVCIFIHVTPHGHQRSLMGIFSLKEPTPSYQRAQWAGLGWGPSGLREETLSCVAARLNASPLQTYRISWACLSSLHRHAAGAVENVQLIAQNPPSFTQARELLRLDPGRRLGELPLCTSRRAQLRRRARTAK